MEIPESSINEILENSPSQETLHLLLPLLKAEGRINLVIRECRKAVSRFPSDFTFKKILTEAYLEEGRLLDAEEEGCRVIEGIINLATAFKVQGEIYLRQGRKEDAALCLKRFLLFYPEDKEAAFKLEELGLTDATLPESGERFIDTGMQELEEELPEIITATLAKVYLDQGKFYEAKDIYEKLAEMNPDDTVAASHFKEITTLSDINIVQAEPPPINERRHKKEKIISILDAWRKNIREISTGAGAG